MTEHIVWDMHELTVWLPNGKPLVDRIDLRARSHKVTHIEGPSGVGKSTVLRCVFAPHTARWQGLRWTHGASTQATSHSMLIQQAPMFDWLSPRENAIDPDDTLLKDWPKHAQHLSGGQRQKIAWMRATRANMPDLLVLDEPLAGLDIQTKQTLTEQLCQYVDQGGAVVLITHDANMLNALGDRVETISLRPASASEQPSTQSSSRPWRDHLIRVCQGIVPLYPTRMPRPWRRALWRTLLSQAMHPRYTLFFFGTGTMLGASLTLVLIRLGATWLTAQHAITNFSLKPIEWLAAPLTAILAATTVGNALGAWLGNQTLRRVPVTLEGLQIDPHLSIWRPAFFVCWLSAQMHQIAFIIGMWAGSVIIAMTMNLQFLYIDALLDLIAQKHVLSCLLTYPLCVALVTIWHASHVVDHATRLTASMIRITTWSTVLVIMLEFVRAWVQS